MSVTANMVQSARLLSGLTVRDVAALADVSPTVVTRAEHGVNTPSVDSYRKMLRAMGFWENDGRLVPLSRPSAIHTARWLLGDLSKKPDDWQYWTHAWQKISLLDDNNHIDDSESLMFHVGRSASVHCRPGSVKLTSDLSAQTMARSLENAGIRYALTGDYALEILGASINPSIPIVYVDDVKRAAIALHLRPQFPHEIGNYATFLPFDGYSEMGRCIVGGVTLASPLQVILDGYAGNGRMVEQAEELAGRRLADDARRVEEFKAFVEDIQ
jgi:transcriptional regulator with XRE-family HTH domain